MRQVCGKTIVLPAGKTSATEVVKYITGDIVATSGPDAVIPLDFAVYMINNSATDVKVTLSSLVTIDNKDGYIKEEELTIAAGKFFSSEFTGLFPRGELKVDIISATAWDNASNLTIVINHLCVAKQNANSTCGVYVYYDRAKKEPIAGIEVQVFKIDEKTTVGSSVITDSRGFANAPPEKMPGGTYSVRARRASDDTVRWQRNVIVENDIMKTVCFNEFPKSKKVKGA